MDYTQLHIKQPFGTKLYVITYNPYSHITTGLHYEWGTEYPPHWGIIKHTTPLVEGGLKVHYVHSPPLTLTSPIFAGK